MIPSLVDRMMNKEFEYVIVVSLYVCVAHFCRLWSSVAKYITHHVTLDTINESFNALKQGNCLRCIIAVGKKA